VFLASGGYDKAFFKAVPGIYFREDIDLGFTLLERGSIIKKAEDVVVRHPRQFHSAADILRHCRRYYFDPLLFRKHRRLYRSSLEMKRFGPLRIHRPFHYLSMFYLLQILVILFLVITGHIAAAAASLPILLVLVAGVRYRYREARLASVLGGTLFFVLPCYYYYWLIRGCLAYRSWGVLY
jgi:thiosulfate reductase cytochrome b subunit